MLDQITIIETTKRCIGLSKGAIINQRKSDFQCDGGGVVVEKAVSILLIMDLEYMFESLI